MGQRHNRRRTRLRPRSRNATTASSLTSSVADPVPQSLAPTWHHGFVTWEARLRPLRPETEQCRLFGGEPGDDVDLCYRMLEYFGGLDYIDS